MVTAVVLTRNEEECIEKCLRSLPWCDEILVIDDLSTDGTINQIRQIGEIRSKIKIIERKSEGNMAELRNFALQKASNDWVFFVDADEVVPSELGREIVSQTDKVENNVDGYYVPRKDFFFGKFLKYGETGKIKLLRLGKRDGGKWERGVHETWKICGSVGELSNSLEHYSHRTIKQFIESINRWTTIDAQELRKEGKDFSLFRVVANPLGKFILNYFLHLGFLDGLAGFVMAYMMSLQSLIVRAKQYDISATT